MQFVPIMCGETMCSLASRPSVFPHFLPPAKQITVRFRCDPESMTSARRCCGQLSRFNWPTTICLVKPSSSGAKIHAAPVFQREHSHGDLRSESPDIAQSAAGDGVREMEIRAWITVASLRPRLKNIALMRDERMRFTSRVLFGR